MIKTKFVFAVSFLAMMAVNVANAKIAATTYVDRGVASATNAANAAQTSASAAKTAADNAQTSADNAQDAADAAQASANEAKASAEVANNAVATKQTKMLATQVTETVEAAKDEYYPSVGLMETSIANANNDVMDSVNAKLASVSTTGTGSVVKSITKNGTAVQGTLGYIASSDITDGTIKNADIASDAAIAVSKISGLGSLATKSAVATGDITDGTITNADISSSAAIAISKISGLQAALDGKQATMTVDSALSSTSTNPVQNKVVNSALAGKQATISDLASIRSGATAGSTALQKADITTGSANGTISVEGTNVAVKGLGTAAYTASTAYATAAQGTKADNAEASANKIDTLEGFDGDKAVAFPTVNLTETLISDANNDVMDSVNAKLASVSTTGTGTVVKAIAKDGTAVKGTLGYITSSDITDGTITNADISSSAAIAVSKINGLGSLATKSAVATGDITDGTITNADISSSAAIAISKISGLQSALDGKQATMTIDSALSSTSTNPVQNKVVNTALAGKQATLTTAQLNAVNSGVTSSTVSQVATNKSGIATNASNIATKEASANKIDTLEGFDGDKAVVFPTVNLTETLISDANNDVMDSVNAKLASVSTTGTGSVVKSITKNGTAVQGTLGYIASSDITDGTIKNADIASDAAIAVSKVSGLGSLATKSAVATGDITDGTITNADISSSAAIAISKISGLQAALDGKQATMTVDSALSSTSTNPVQNKVVNTALAGKQATLTTAQLNAVNSGVTSSTVSQVATNKSGIATNVSNIATKEASANKIDTLDGFDGDKAVAFPTVNLTETLISDANNDVMDSVNEKVDKAQGSSAASKAVITNSSGTITTGTIATGMITDSAVTSAKLAANAVTSAKISDGAVALADLASNSVNSSKIVDASVATADLAGSSVTTAKIADAAVTPAKTSGVIGSIPSGSATSTTYATIWVE